MEDWRQKCKEEITTKKAEQYCRVYSRTEGLLRERGILSASVGYNLLIQAVCFQKLLRLKDEKLMDMLEYTSIIPANMEAERELNLRNEQEYLNCPVLQWMREALRAAGIKEHPLEFIEEIVSEVE